MKTLPSLITPPARLLFVALLLAAFFAKPGQLAAATVMNIEIDYMDSTPTGGHSHGPQPDEIAAVVQMFACHGITLNIVVDQAIPALRRHVGQSCQWKILRLLRGNELVWLPAVPLLRTRRPSRLALLHLWPRIRRVYEPESQRQFGPGAVTRR